ncbi:small, acid-soluble spore protein K [bacterium LRH843]|nr:small, acid-soluble spore protein K [bacterium LRH843]
MRNKAKGFPGKRRFYGESPNNNEHQSQRANGTINTRPQERMRESDK